MALTICLGRGLIHYVIMFSCVQVRGRRRGDSSVFRHGSARLRVSFVCLAYKSCVDLLAPTF